MWFPSSSLSPCTWGILSRHVISPATLKLPYWKDQIERPYRDIQRLLNPLIFQSTQHQPPDLWVTDVSNNSRPRLQAAPVRWGFPAVLSESLTHSMWEHNKWLSYITRFWSNLLSSQSNWNRKGGYYLHLKLWNRAHCYKGDFANIWLTHSLLILLVLLSALWDSQKMLGSSSKPWLPAWVGKVSSWAVCSSAERGLESPGYCYRSMRPQVN